VKRILVCDDDSGMRTVLKAFLNEAGHTVIEAPNGQAAKDLLGKSEKVDLVISDVQMPGIDGIDLLNWVRANIPVPFILITGFSHILETKRAFDLGADDFLTKPFRYKEVLASVDRVLGLAASDGEKQTAADEYCRIPIEDFVSSTGVQMNVYIRLGENKFIRVAHKGDPLPEHRVDTYKAKGISHLFAKKEDFALLVGFSLNLSKVVQASTSVPVEKKIRFLRYTSELVLEHAAVNGIDKQAFSQAKDFLDVCVQVITESDTLTKVLDALNSHSDWLYAHSLGVSLYSIMIGKQLKWSRHSTMFKLGAAGLFHDIGQKEIDRALLTKRRSLMSKEERQLFETHPTRSKEILQDLGELPHEIAQIVHEHHEDCTGRGYPRQIEAQKVHPLAKVIAIADRFCYLAMDTPTSKGCNAKTALDQMEVMYSGEMDRGAFLALRQLTT